MKRIIFLTFTILLIVSVFTGCMASVDVERAFATVPLADLPEFCNVADEVVRTNSKISEEKIDVFMAELLYSYNNSDEAGFCKDAYEILEDYNYTLIDDYKSTLKSVNDTQYSAFAVFHYRLDTWCENYEMGIYDTNDLYDDMLDHANTLSRYFYDRNLFG